MRWFLKGKAMPQRRTPESKLSKVMDNLALITSTIERDELLLLIMRSVKEVMEVEAGSLALLDDEKGELYFHTIAGGKEKIKEIRLKLGQGIAGRVAETGTPMIVNDVEKSKYFFKTADQKTKFKTKAILCVPLLIRGKVTAVLQALNKVDGSDFNKGDLFLFQSFAKLVSVALENAKLYSLAVYDGLTNIFVRRYFEAWIGTEYPRVKRYQSDLSLIMLDIDHFKRFNDTYGHQAGDYVLRETVKTIKAVTRKADVFARYGGEEFVIACPETPPDKAINLAERIRETVEEHAYEWEGQKLSVTISLGIASFAKKAEERADLFLRDADSALYASKEGGRNRVSLFEEKLAA